MSVKPSLFVARDHDNEVIEYLLVDYNADYDDILRYIKEAEYEEDFSEENSGWSDTTYIY